MFRTEGSVAPQVRLRFFGQEVQVGAIKVGPREFWLLMRLTKEF